MRVEIEPGKYILAVSGGVDSVSLLDALSKLPNVEVIVAHFDHGIRPDSHKDAEFVADLTREYRTDFECKTGNLGPNASEETARNARYEFLESVKKKHGAKAIITAHHQDDLIETAIINILRGTGRKGLSSLKSTDGFKRPLLPFSKKQIIDYARSENLVWREDPSNKNEKYLRNFIRAKIMPKLSNQQRKSLLTLLNTHTTTNNDIDERIISYLKSIYLDKDETKLDQIEFVKMPHSLACEVLAAWLRRHKIAFDKPTIERLAVQLKTKPAHTQLDISQNWHFLIDEKQISLQKVK
jgi:tRNA(Ile)-lysidine synthetase-like protein